MDHGVFTEASTDSMSSKHVFNDPEDLVVKSLRGAVILNPALRLHAASKTVFLSREAASRSKAKVLVIAGGGAGHEPASASYVGLGMLRSAVSGDIFASPSASQIRTAIDLALSVSRNSGPEPKEILLVVNNYTGDRLNFGLAAETVRSKGIDLATITVADDVAVGRTPLGAVGRRGLAGYILVSKLLGAAAERGFCLKDVESLGSAVVKNLASIGLSLDHCHVPGKGKKPGDWEKLPEESCELGLGLHNERGAKRMDKTPQPNEIIRIMLEPLLDSTDTERSFVHFSKNPDEEVILFINNLGGLSQLEMGGIVDEVFTQLGKMNIHPSRVFCSSYMTSLNAPGFSISLLNVTTAQATWQKELHSPPLVSIPELFDDPTGATAWIGARTHWPQSPGDLSSESNEADELPGQESSRKHMLSTSVDNDSILMKNIIASACEAVLGAESVLTEYDTVCGDGDCGFTFATGARAVMKTLRSSMLPLNDPAMTAVSIAEICENSMGGTSGALFALFFTSLSSALQTVPLTEACHVALQSLGNYTPARPGDRTLVDALEPFCSALRNGQSFSDAVLLAKEGAEKTKGMVPKLGRAVYVGEQGGQTYSVPDPGAWGAYVILKGISDTYNG